MGGSPPSASPGPLCPASLCPGSAMLPRVAWAPFLAPLLCPSCSVAPPWHLSRQGWGPQGNLLESKAELRPLPAASSSRALGTPTGWWTRWWVDSENVPSLESCAAWPLGWFRSIDGVPILSPGSETWRWGHVRLRISRRGSELGQQQGVFPVWRSAASTRSHAIP